MDFMSLLLGQLQVGQIIEEIGFLEICIKDGTSIPITRATLYDTSIGSGARVIHSPATPSIASEMKVYHVPVISRACL